MRYFLILFCLILLGCKSDTYLLLDLRGWFINYNTKERGLDMTNGYLEANKTRYLIKMDSTGFFNMKYVFDYRSGNAEIGNIGLVGPGSLMEKNSNYLVPIINLDFSSTNRTMLIESYPIGLFDLSVPDYADSVNINLYFWQYWEFSNGKLVPFPTNLKGTYARNRFNFLDKYNHAILNDKWVKYSYSLLVNDTWSNSKTDSLKVVFKKPIQRILN